MGLVLGAMLGTGAVAQEGGARGTVLPAAPVPDDAAGTVAPKPRFVVPEVPQVVRGMPETVDGAPGPAPSPEHVAALADAGPEERRAVLAFYEARDFAPFWTEGDAGIALIETLRDAGRHGLPVSRYSPGEMESLVAGGDPVAAEIGLTRAYLRYARDMTGGAVDPRAVDAEINLAPKRPGDAELLALLEGAPVAEVLAGLVPDTPEYAALLAERERLEAVAQEGGWGARVPEGPALRPGDMSPRVAALRARLRALGYEAPGEGERYDAALATVVETFQRENGLVADGVLGARTLAALNASPQDRIDQITVALERIRWMPDDLGMRYVWVNIPDYTVSVFEEGERVYHTRAVVGEPGETRTPEFSERMTYLVVNPTWYIPDSIAKRVYLPQLRRNPDVLRNNNMRLFTRAGTEIDPALVNFAALGDSFPFRVRQNPSPANALGRVKFMFPNQFAIYLHDTPARELFNRDRRAFSNGCVRLEDPFELAYYLLAPQLDDPETTFRSWVEAGAERNVTLEQPIQVHIVYRTAWADADGVHYRADVYGRDRKLLAALMAADIEAAARQTVATSTGSAG